MKGPAPKPAALRQRRNKASTRALIQDDKGNREPPPLPSRGRKRWLPMTVEYWNAIWRSPMADEYLQVDLHRLYMYIQLVDAFWRVGDLDILKEIRLQGQAFGLAPLDRRRLEWEIEPDDKTASQKNAMPGKRSKALRNDPRRSLRVV